MTDIERKNMNTQKTIKINNVDFVRADSVPAAPPQKPERPLTVGNAVFLRTVTLYYTGRVAEVTEQSVVLTDAAWVADTGRFSEALSSGILGEVEPFPGPVEIGRGAIVDVTLWAHTLPRAVK